MWGQGTTAVQEGTPLSQAATAVTSPNRAVEYLIQSSQHHKSITNRDQGQREKLSWLKLCATWGKGRYLRQHTGKPIAVHPDNVHPDRPSNGRTLVDIRRKQPASTLLSPSAEGTQHTLVVLRAPIFWRGCFVDEKQVPPIFLVPRCENGGEKVLQDVLNVWFCSLHSLLPRVRSADGYVR